MLGGLFGRGPRSDESALPTGTVVPKPAYAFAIKKSGTHLLRNVLAQMGLPVREALDYECMPSDAALAPAGNGIVLTHTPPSREWRGRCHAGTATILMHLRDPRAIFLSLLDFYDWNRPLSATAMHTVEFRRESCREAFADRESLGHALIEDEAIDDDPFTPWLALRRARTLYHNPRVLKVRYEELAAAAERRAVDDVHPVVRLARHLATPIPPRPDLVLSRAIGAPSLTMNVGDADRWRHDLSPTLLAAFMARHGDLVREFGYESG